MGSGNYFFFKFRFFGFFFRSLREYSCYLDVIIKCIGFIRCSRVIYLLVLRLKVLIEVERLFLVIFFAIIILFLWIVTLNMERGVFIGVRFF